MFGGGGGYKWAIRYWYPINTTRERSTAIRLCFSTENEIPWEQIDSSREFTGVGRFLPDAKDDTLLTAAESI